MLEELYLVGHLRHFTCELFYISSDFYDLKWLERPCVLPELPHRLPHNYTIGFIIIT